MSLNVWITGNEEISERFKCLGSYLYMQHINDNDAQCLVEDGEGTWFLCPIGKKDEALAYFEALHDYSDEGASPHMPFLVYLEAVSDFENLIVFKSKIVPGVQPQSH